MSMDVINWNNFQFCQLSAPHLSLENRKLQERITSDVAMYVSLSSNTCDYALWRWWWYGASDEGGGGGGGGSGGGDEG